MYDSSRKSNLTVPDEILCELEKIVVSQSSIESMLSNEIIRALEIDSRKLQRNIKSDLYKDCNLLRT